ncbi:MAG: hypothetical protein IJR59_06760 [Firmicutes bacterium]|nr:hypothetical protein [Bacillota bacterium]
MKKILAVFFIAVLSLGTTSIVSAAESLPANDVELPVYGTPVKLDDKELDKLFEPALETFSEDEAPDWLKNTDLHFYEYLKNGGFPDEYPDAYKRIYNALYGFCASSDARVIEYSDMKYLLVDISADLEQSEMTQTGLIDSSEPKYFDFYHIVSAVTDDNPQFYCTDNMRNIFYSDSRICMGISIENDYSDAGERIKQNEKITAAVAEYDKAVEGLDSNYLIEKAVHDKIILENDYAYDENGDPSGAAYAHNIVGIMDPDYEGGVCESYSRAFLFLMNRYNVPCYYAAGLTAQGGHAWNLVMLDDGEYHCIDCTWDDNYITYGNTKIPILYYKHFNKPYTSFYGNDSRDNSYCKITAALPTTISENTNFYDTVYDGNNYLNQPYTSDGHGGRIYPAPTVTYPKKRVYYTESDINAEQSDPDEYTGDFTPYSGYDDIIISGKSFVKIEKDNSNWQLGRFSSGNKLIVASRDGELSFLTEYNMTLSFDTYLQNGELTVYVDGKEYTKKSASSYLQPISVSLPCGRHKVTVSYSGTYMQLYNVNAKPKADVDGSETIDILDAIYFENLASLSAASNTNAEYLRYDLNGDSVIDKKDLKIILKEAVKASV